MQWCCSRRALGSCGRSCRFRRHATSMTSTSWCTLRSMGCCLSAAGPACCQASPCSTVHRSRPSRASMLQGKRRWPRSVCTMVQILAACHRGASCRAVATASNTAHCRRCGLAAVTTQWPLQLYQRCLLQASQQPALACAAPKPIDLRKMMTHHGSQLRRPQRSLRSPKVTTLKLLASTSLEQE
jgi:hypothetical protein